MAENLTFPVVAGMYQIRLKDAGPLAGVNYDLPQIAASRAFMGAKMVAAGRVPDPTKYFCLSEGRDDIGYFRAPDGLMHKAQLTLGPDGSYKWHETDEIDRSYYIGNPATGELGSWLGYSKHVFACLLAAGASFTLPANDITAKALAIAGLTPAERREYYEVRSQTL